MKSNETKSNGRGIFLSILCLVQSSIPSSNLKLVRFGEPIGEPKILQIFINIKVLLIYRLVGNFLKEDNVQVFINGT
jgi:hypothetical protein